MDQTNRLSGQQQHSGVGSMKKHALKRRLDPPACAANSCSTAEDEPRPAAVTSSSLRHAKKARVSAAMDGSAAPATAEYASLPAIGASHPGAEGQPAVSSKRQCLLRMLKLARAVNAAGSQQEATLPAAVAAANSSMSACIQAIGMSTILIASAAGSDVTEHALAVADVALAVTQRQINRAKQIVLEQCGPEELQHLHHEALPAAAIDDEPDELSDTCTSTSSCSTATMP